VAFEIQFAESAKRQLDTLSAHDRALLIARIESQLSHEPLKNTRNRKMLQPNPVAPRELRVRHMRVFYDVMNDKDRVVNILAVGIKRGNKLLIDDQEIQL
jgi:mRNA-degrading endonuclease RelE of RelBE toxin-antitoxin system